MAQSRLSDLIAFGLVVQYGKLLATELGNLLQLADKDRLRNYTSRLLDMGVLVTRGVKKGTAYMINPKLVASARLNVKTTLKTIEPHRLKALIMEDLRLHPESGIQAIAGRLTDVDVRDVRKVVYQLVADGDIEPQGAKSNRTYVLRE